MDIPRIISVDDHVVEPPDLWTEPAAGEVSRTGPRASSATRRSSTSRAACSPTRRASTDGELVRLVALRRPRLPVPASCRPRSGSTSSTSRPTTFDEIRPGCWKQARPPRRHGRQPRRRVDLLPEHAAPLLRPDVPRARRQGARAPVRAGLQRLDDRRVVRRRRARAA